MSITLLWPDEWPDLLRNLKAQWPARKRTFFRWVLREFVQEMPRPWRRRLFPHYWPVEARVLINLASEDEKINLAHRRKFDRAESAKRAQLRKLVGEYRHYLIGALTRVGVSHVQKIEGAKKISRVKIRHTRVSEQAIYFEVDTAKLPWHTNITMLYDEATLQTLSAACTRRVRYIWDRPEDGFWYIVELTQGVRGVPRSVDYADMLSKIKQDAPPLTIPIGVGEAGRLYYRNLADFPHALVAGATNTGKSVWVKQALVTLVLRNPPDRLKLVLVDLKGGVELSQFKNIPHLLMPIVKHKDNVVTALSQVLHEVDKRLEIFERTGVVNIAGYNQRRFYSERPLPMMPFWVVVIDELANLMLDPDIKGRAETLLADIAARARAAGIHVIAATQTPRVSVITGLIKANFPVRIAFSTASATDSQVIIDSSHAAGIGPVGRMIFFMGPTKSELQGPFISPSMVDDKIQGIVEGKRDETLERSKRHSYTHEDFFMHSLLKFDGRVAVKPLYEHFREMGVSRTDIERAVTRFDGQVVELTGKLYRLENPNTPGQKLQARRLVEVPLPDADRGEAGNAETGEAESGTTPAITGNQYPVSSPEIETAHPPTDGAGIETPNIVSDEPTSDDAEPDADADDTPAEPFDQFSHRINQLFGRQ